MRSGSGLPTRSPIPERAEIITVAYAVALSIFIRGLTMQPLMQRLGLIEQGNLHEEAKATMH